MKFYCFYSSGPSRDWLKIVKSNQAKTKIRQWFKREDRDVNLVRGQEAVEQEVRKRDYSYAELLKDEWLQEIANRHALNSIDDLFVAVGYGTVSTNQVVNKLEENFKEYYKTTHSIQDMADFKVFKPKAPGGVEVEGIDNIKIKLAGCCNPLPGDKIVGYITRGSGVSVHRTDCSNLKNIPKERLINVHWTGEGENDRYQVDLDILAFDLQGYLAEVTGILNEYKVPIIGVQAKTTKIEHWILN